jgi:cell division protease FtsH
MYKDKMLEEISILFGGRIAEEIFMNQMSTGASNDFERATKLARDMVTRYGMSVTLGPWCMKIRSRMPLRPHVLQDRVRSHPAKVDAEIRSILDEQYALARRLLEENRDKVDVMAKALLEWETIDADQVNDIMNGDEPRPPRNGVPAKKSSSDNNRSGDVSPNATAPA